MRCNPWRWLWGVIPIAMLTWLACTWEREGIETDLRSRSEAALEDKGFGWGQVSIDGRDAFLTGVAPDESQPYQATEAVRNVRGIRVVRSRTDAGPQVTDASPDVMPAPVPAEPAAPDMQELSDAERAELEARSAAAREHERRWRAGAPAVAEVEPRDAPDRDVAAIDMAPLSGAARAELEKRWEAAREQERRWKSEGMASRAMDDDAADGARRRAADEEAARTAEAEKQRIAEDEAKRQQEEAARAAEAEKQRLAEEDAKRRQEEESARAAEAEKQRLAEEDAKRREEEAREQAEAEAEAQKLADEQARAEEEAAAKRRADDEAAAARRAEEEAAATKRQEQDVAAAREKDAADAKRKAEADHCQGLMRSAMAEGTINFARAKSDITRSSNLTLDRLAGIAKVCPQAQINIAGHTDSEGEVERNQGLSERRAKAVGDYLIAKGVDASRVKTEGFGELRPLVPNDTPEGMRQNRRIEFNVTPGS
jgi:OOP family OmpA-OmpF porin